MHKYKESNNLLEFAEQIIVLQSINCLASDFYDEWKLFVGQDHAGPFFCTSLYTSLLLPSIMLEADSFSC